MHISIEEPTNTQSSPAPTRVAGYIRVEATSEIEQEWSDDWQRSVIEQFCADPDEYQVTEVYADIGNEGRGRNPFDRAGFADLVADFEGGAFDLVVIASVDRISGSLATALRTMEELEKSNLSVRLVREDIFSNDPGVTFQMVLMRGVSQPTSADHSVSLDRGRQLREEVAS